MGVHTPTVGFYKMAAHTFRCVDVKCAVGMGLQENGSIVMYVARDGFYKMGAGNLHDQLIPNQPQEKSSIKWHWVLRGGSIYKMGSTNWGGPTPPTLKTRWIAILFCARPHPFCRGNWRGDWNSLNFIYQILLISRQHMTVKTPSVSYISATSVSTLDFSGPRLIP